MLILVFQTTFGRTYALLLLKRSMIWEIVSVQLCTLDGWHTLTRLIRMVVLYLMVLPLDRESWSWQMTMICPCFHHVQLHLPACFAQWIPTRIPVQCFQIIALIKLLANNWNNSEQDDKLAALQQSTWASPAFLLMNVFHIIIAHWSAVHTSPWKQQLSSSGIQINAYNRKINSNNRIKTGHVCSFWPGFAHYICTGSTACHARHLTVQSLFERRRSADTNCHRVCCDPFK